MNPARRRACNAPVLLNGPMLVTDYGGISVVEAISRCGLSIETAARHPAGG
jgi:hypothetical protein